MITINSPLCVGDVGTPRCCFLLAWSKEQFPPSSRCLLIPFLAGTVSGARAGAGARTGAEAGARTGAGAGAGARTGTGAGARTGAGAGARTGGT